jgi:outer membrane protein OmpA-like peptidoglycan-associated protein
MQVKGGMRVLMVAVAILSLSVMFGCAGMEFAPNDSYPYWYYPKELAEASRAIADARQAGKDKECPAEFEAVKALEKKAYDVYVSCRTEEAVALAKEATAKAKALCVIARMTLHVNFDFNKSNIRQADIMQLKKAAEFVKKHRGSKVKLEGHTDGKGTEQYNQKLSERRAEAVKKYLIKEGAVGKTKITAMGYGKTRPVAPNTTKDGKDDPEGRAKNRRVEILIMSK